MSFRRMRPHHIPTLVTAAVAAAVLRLGAAPAPPAGPQFELVQPELFAAPGGQPNAWADMDNDGQLDLFVGFRGRANRLYRQEKGTFRDVATEVGLADSVETRVAAWGDFDGDGQVDLYVGFAGGAPNKLYRNDGNGKHFTDVAPQLGLDLKGVTRQASFIDVDNDGDLDLFIAFRDQPNRLFRNDGGRFTDITAESGIGDTRKTVGAVWFDMDQDGDLDLFVANQDGDLNGLWRNDHGHFVDVAKAYGVDGAPRPSDFGGVGPSVGDYDHDGWFDLFVANYGPSALYHNERGKAFTNETKATGLDFEGHAVTSVWGDYDNDGWPDLYISGFLANITHYPDHLFHHSGSSAGPAHFTDVIPDLVKQHDASHGVQWVDFDNDGALDLALANNDPGGGHYLLRNAMPRAEAKRSLSIDVVDVRGRRTKPGAEVRVYAAGTRTLVASAMVDTGSGYCSQNQMPVHVGTGLAARVDVEVTSLAAGGRQVTRQTGLDPTKAPRPLRIVVK